MKKEGSEDLRCAENLGSFSDVKNYDPPVSRKKGRGKFQNPEKLFDGWGGRKEKGRRVPISREESPRKGKREACSGRKDTEDRGRK